MREPIFGVANAMCWIGLVYCANLLCALIPGLERLSPTTDPYRSLAVGLMAWLGFGLYKTFAAARLNKTDKTEQA
jgi:hypothetical protein